MAARPPCVVPNSIGSSSWPSCRRAGWPAGRRQWHLAGYRVRCGIKDRAGEDFTLPRASKHVYSAHIGYEKYGVSTRPAAVYRSEYLDSIGKGRAFDIYVAPNTQLDFSLDYKFTPRVSVYFEAQNLLDKPLSFTGHPFAHPADGRVRPHLCAGPEGGAVRGVASPSGRCAGSRAGRRLHAGHRHRSGCGSSRAGRRGRARGDHHRRGLPVTDDPGRQHRLACSGARRTARCG